MAYEGLAERLGAALKRLRSKGRLTEDDVRASMREVRLALLEADVNFKVAKEFIAKVTERAIGTEVLESLTPAQQVIKIVNEELTALMGGEQSRLDTSGKPPAVMMLCGLQGAGKTTHAAKLALFYKNKGRRPLLAACDIYRPAAIKQLQVLGGQVGCPVFEMGETDPVKVAKAAVENAREHGNDIVLLDTAGRLHVDEALMDELRRIKAATQPNETLLVVDAMTGQDAVNVASSFNETLDITGVILTKTDGDTRGGAALSVKAVTGKPIKLCGTGEKLGDLEPFHPARMASRILGMGDVLTLIEKAQQGVDEQKARELEQKLRKNSFDLNDFAVQLREIRKMGPLRSVLEMMPGVGQQLKNVDIDERQFYRIGDIIGSMTLKEREHPDIINPSRKRRIATGSGTRVEDVNRLLKQFTEMQKLFKQMNAMKGKHKKGRPFLPHM